MRVECTCQRCGATFSVVPAQVKRGRAKFCSKPCANDARRLQITCVCARCGEAFLVKRWFHERGIGTFCSNRCRGAAQTKPRHERTCQMCAAPFLIQEWQAEKGEGQFCSATCRDLGAHIARRDPPDIRLGTRYYGWSWRDASRQARQRDGRCTDCGITPGQVGKALDVHHIVSFKRFGIRRHIEANDLTNLVTLCQPCHIRREWATNWRRD